MKNLAPNRIRSPDRPARSESLHRLSYRGTLIKHIILNNKRKDDTKMEVPALKNSHVSEDIWKSGNFIQRIAMYVNSNAIIVTYVP